MVDNRNQFCAWLPAEKLVFGGVPARDGHQSNRISLAKVLTPLARLTRELNMQHARDISAGATRYFKEIQRFPMLKAEEEQLLAASWREAGDPSAAHRLLTSHLRLVAKIAMGYRRYGLPTSDLISEGNLGLMEAVRRFEPDKGVRFSTYAICWIKAAIHNYILRSWSLVKLGTTVNQKKLFFNLAKAKQRFSALQEGDLHPEQASLIASGLGVTEKDVVEMNRRLSGDISLNAPVSADADSVEWQDRLVDEASDQETHFAEAEELEARRRALGVALSVLNVRERRIFEARRLVDPPRSLDELAVEFRICRERVRQIEAAAFQKVQRAALVASKRTQHPLRVHRSKAKSTPSAQSTVGARNGATNILSGNWIGTAA
jgi:RNA polymerase sigma-32 factor